MWECGLKHTKSGYYSRLCNVTPYVGVWIETIRLRAWMAWTPVTPYVGVWIETGRSPHELPTAPSLLMWECGLKQRSYRM